MDIKIPGIIGMSLIDYPDKVSGVIFLAGCNFRCPYCHNISIVENIKQLEFLDPEYVINEFRRRKKILDALVITGGEPTIYQDLPIFIRRLKDLGYLIKLDTNGYNPVMIKELISSNLLDFISMDIKTSLDEEKYSKVAGVMVCINKIIESIGIIKGSYIDYEFRTTLIDGFVDFSDIKDISYFIKPAKKYYIQTANTEWKGFSSPDIDKIKLFVEGLKKNGIEFIEIR